MRIEGDGLLPRTITGARIPIKAYTTEIEPDCLQQLLCLANSPVPVGHVACMPDVHLGKGATIGSVFASEKYIAPMAVGVDIGCGMVAVPVQGLHRGSEELGGDRLQVRGRDGLGCHGGGAPDATLLLTAVETPTRSPNASLSTSLAPGPARGLPLPIGRGRTVHRCPGVSDTVARCGTCGGCHCVRGSADTPPPALRRASVPPVRTMN